MELVTAMLPHTVLRRLLISVPVLVDTVPPQVLGIFLRRWATQHTQARRKPRRGISLRQ